MLELGREVAPASLTGSHRLQNGRWGLAAGDRLRKPPQLPLDAAKLALEPATASIEPSVLLPPQLDGPGRDVVHQVRRQHVPEGGHHGQCARLGMVSGRGLASVIRRRYSRPVLWGACALLIVANVINIGADLGGMVRFAGV